MAIPENVVESSNLTESFSNSDKIHQMIQGLDSVEEMDEIGLRLTVRNLLLILKEKEQDLIIAAQIGSTLVETNTNLMAENQEITARIQAIEAGVPRDVIGKERRLKRSKSIEVFNQIANLEKVNLELREQLENRLQLSKCAQQELKEQISGLKSSNEQLKEELQVALKQGQRTDNITSKEVKQLKESVELLKEELMEAQATALTREQECEQLQKEKVDILKEKWNLAASDKDLINSLQEQVKTLHDAKNSIQTTKQEKLAKLKQLGLENSQLKDKISLLEARCEEVDKLQDAFNHQIVLIEQLNAQLEQEREERQELKDRQQTMIFPSWANNAPTGDSSDLSQNKAWKWGSWLDRSWVKILERDITGLRAEVSFN